MNKKYTCESCGYIFGSNALTNAYLRERTVILRCPSCHKENIIRENASCDCGYGQIGPGCKRMPVYLIPYKTREGFSDFKCACKYDYRHLDIPYSGFIPETHEALSKAMATTHPILCNIPVVVILFVANGWIPLLYSLAGSQFAFFAMTRFSFFWLMFCLLWVAGYKIGFVRLTAKLYKFTLMIWIGILFVIIILEVSIHIFW